jgi:hypothetical protein
MRRATPTVRIALAVCAAAGAFAAPARAATKTTTSASPTRTAVPTTTSTTPTATPTRTAVPPPPGSACGQTIDVGPPASGGALGAPALALGDSVLYDAARPLSEVGFHVNAMVCRTMAQGITWLEAHARNLPLLVVVELGTNGAVSAGQIEQLLTILGPERLLALVTPHGGNAPYAPALYRSAATHFAGRIEVLDWDRLGARHPEWFAADGIHLAGPAGIEALARLIASALTGLGGPVTTPAAAAPSTTIQPATATARPQPRRRPLPAPPALDKATVAPVIAAISAVEAFVLGLFGA